MVAGGHDGDGDNKDSTEIMSSTGTSWLYVGKLPSARESLIGISINNQMFMTG